MIVKHLKGLTEVLSNTIITNKAGISYEHQTAYNLIRLAIKGLRKTDGTLFLIGNGGSNAIISHAAVDILNKYNIKVNPLTDSSLITCMANDYEYYYAYLSSLSIMLTKNDILIAVSSSGQSPSILNPVDDAIKQGIEVITFSGFNSINPLRGMGNYNFWLDSYDYGIVETGHSFLLHLLTDEWELDKDEIAQKALGK